MTEDFEDPDADEFLDEDENIPTPSQIPAKVETRGRPKMVQQPQAQPQQRQPIKKEQSVDDDTYAAYHIPERNGIANKKTNAIVGEDILSILATILNKIEKIERATC